jgi:ABC-type iron transport system FetAB permease component
MSRFEFNTVLVSIVLAFAISEILTAWGRLIRYRGRVRSVSLFVLASSWTLVAILAHWFGIWAYRGVPFDNLFQTLLVVLPSLVIALVCFIWVPDIATQDDFDVERHYFESARWTLPLIAIFLVLGVASDILVPNVESWGTLRAVIPLAGIIVGSAFSRRRAVHFAAFGASWLAFVVFMGLGS